MELFYHLSPFHSIRPNSLSAPHQARRPSRAAFAAGCSHSATSGHIDLPRQAAVSSPSLALIIYPSGTWAAFCVHGRWSFSGGKVHFLRLKRPVKAASAQCTLCAKNKVTNVCAKQRRSVTVLLTRSAHSLRTRAASERGRLETWRTASAFLVTKSPQKAPKFQLWTTIVAPHAEIKLASSQLGQEGDKVAQKWARNWAKCQKVV